MIKVRPCVYFSGFHLVSNLLFMVYGQNAIQSMRGILHIEMPTGFWLNVAT